MLGDGLLGSMFPRPGGENGLGFAFYLLGYFKPFLSGSVEPPNHLLPNPKFTAPCGLTLPIEKRF